MIVNNKKSGKIPDFYFIMQNSIDIRNKKNMAKQQKTLSQYF